MGKSVNLLDSESATLFRGQGSWNVSNGTLFFERNDVFAEKSSTMQITPILNNQPVILTYSGVSVPKDFVDDFVHFHCRIKVVIPSIVRVELTNTQVAPPENVVAKDTGTGFNSWRICRSPNFKVFDTGEDNKIDIKIVVSNHAGALISFSVPFIGVSGNIFRDLYVLETFRNLPAVIREAEINHEELHGMPDFPLTRFIELAGNFAGDVVSDYYAFQYLTKFEGKNPNDPTTLSALIDPNAAKPQYLPWLSQFVGVYLDNPTTGKTPWQNIPPEWMPIEQQIDPASNPTYVPTVLSRASNVVTATIGTHVVSENKWVTIKNSTSSGTTFNGTFRVTSTTGTTISWSQTGSDESAINKGQITLLDTEWFELENFNPNLDGLLDYLRWQVKNAYTGMHGGTYAAIVNSAKRVLTGDKVVTVRYAHDGDPWKVLVRTKTSESPDGFFEEDPPADGVKSFTIETYLNRAKPAGYKIIHECTADGITA